ncbi:ABC transporter substrate-binding protein [Sediminispirochaeta bajacaliforniensis]|uniref:ABC transporter substrate-binding protein n=1 Tax=Sediminispirochaeta bajacaliforniensis TaxID=148 RepID=UPI00036A0B10|nr:ABC transporter substrate-binding protein [Sediminispirochaeta bajacaliforniensis]
MILLNIHIKRNKLLLLCCLLLLVITASGDELRKVRVQLKWTHQFQFAGFYAAIDQCYYAKRGLEVELREGNPAISPTDEVVSRRADFGINTTDLIVHRSLGKPIVILAPIFQHSSQVVAVSGKSDIYAPCDLEGKSLMLSGDGEASILAMFRSQGITDISIIPHSWDIMDLVNGKVDAMSVYLTGEVYTLRRLKLPFRILRPENYGIDFYGDVLFTSEALATEDADLVNRFLTATLDGWHYALKNKEAMMDLIIEKYGYHDSLERLRYESDMISTLMGEGIVRPGHSSPSRWQHIIDTYDSLDMLSRAVDIKEMVFQRSPKLSHKQGTSIFLLLTAFLALFLFFVSSKFFTGTLWRKMEHKVGRQYELDTFIKFGFLTSIELPQTVHRRVIDNLQIIDHIIPAAESVTHKNSRHENRKNIELIDLCSYLHDLVSLTDRNFNAEESRTIVDIPRFPVIVPIELAVPIGLITVELHTNALKHTSAKEGKIRITLKQEEKEICTLSVGDSGPGVDEKLFHHKRTKTTGLPLIQLLTKQIGGSLEVSSRNGTSITLRFPLRKQKEKTIGIRS